MSGCYPMELCPHGSLLGTQQCYHCELTDKLAALNNRINGLHANKLQQIELNQKADEKFKRNEKQIDKVVEMIVKVEMKFENEIDELEKKYQDKAIDQQSIRNNIAAIFERIEKLEKDVSHLRTKFLCEDYMINSLNNNDKKPHKCPVCDGNGKNRNVLFSMPPQYPDCHSCNGKGIIWA